MKPRTLLRASSFVSLLALAGCAVPASDDTTLAPDPGAVAQQSSELTTPHYTIRLHAISCADDDGGHAVGITREQVKQWVDKANAIFTAADAGITISFDVSAGSLDYETRNDTKLNQLSSGASSGWPYANQIAAKYPGKLVVYFRWGADADATGNGFSFPPTDSGTDTGFVAMPGFDKTGVEIEKGNWVQNIWQLAHDIGHHLGLNHTFPGSSDGGSDTDAEVTAILDAKGVAGLDGDGIADTPAEAGTAYFDKKGWQRCTGHDTYEVKDSNGAAYTLSPARHNVMSYFACETMAFTKGQVDKMRATLQHPLRKHLITRPCHADFYGIASSKFQTCFDYWIHRGLWPVTLAAYQTGGSTYMAGSFQPGTNRPVYMLMTQTDFEGRVASFKSQGFRPSQVNVLSTTNGPRYTAVWQPSETSFFETHASLTASQLDSKHTFLRSWSFDLVDLASFQVGSETRYAGTWVYRSTPVDEVSSKALTFAQYDTLFDSMFAAGKRPTRFSAAATASGTRYTALFAPMTAAFYHYPAMTAPEYETQYATLSRQGFRLEHVHVLSGSTPRFSVIWTK